ncbi:MAG: error-prone DNA polymerase [Hyphomicrobiales bacterium]|nr:error-prone DNA polymerase [Hyphomicrobiales bacterium]
MSGYAELVAMSNFSFLRGASHPEELVVQAKALGLSAIAICDRNSLAGVVRGHTQAKADGIKFIPGCRLILMDGVEIACLPANRAAYGRLCRMLTTGNRRAPKAQCFLWLDDLIAYGEGQIFIALPKPDLQQDNVFSEALRTLARCFPGAVYLGAAPRLDGLDARRFMALSALARETGAPLLAIGDCLYHHFDRRPLQDVLTCIREKCTIATAGFKLEANCERYLRAPQETTRLFRGYEQAIARTLDIAKRCRFSLDELKYEYPDEPYEPYASPQEALQAHAWAGAVEKFPGGVPDKIRVQIEHELALIAQLDYARYVLTVFDLVRYARSREILCQGRGSAANSAVCYCLGVTSVNPAEVDLLFERFISSERGEPPDIDIDFEHERREEVMQYIYEKYGRHRAGIVATVICYRDKMAIREVGKALGLSEDVIGALSGMLAWWSEGVTDDDIRHIGLNPADRTLRMAVRLARELTGFPRHLSQHTGGFVITRGPLDEIIPIGNAAMAERTMIEWNKDDLDDLGLLKVDVLALGMLTCVRKAFALIEAHHGRKLTLASIPQGDEATYDMIGRADTIGVFQIESRAQMSMLPRLKPRKFYDLVIEVAIVRPGPIQGDMVHPYLRRRQKLEEVTYESPALEGILKRTLGVPLFQEQCMKIAIVAAGFAPSRADQLRRAMATFKKVGTIHTFEAEFMAGMAKNGYSPDFAARCFAQIKGFGTYGFPESHAASFALLVYVSCYIKCHYPDAFAAALLNSQPMGFYAPAQIVRDFREHGGEVRAVDINHSDWNCTLEAAETPGVIGHALRLGFREMKGFSETHAKAIMAARGEGFASLNDFARRTELPFNALKTLAEADAFRSIGLDRREALWTVSCYAETGTPAGIMAELPLFAARQAEPLPDEAEVVLPKLTLGEHVLQDYAAIRMSLKAHPLALLRGSFAAQGYIPAQQLATMESGRTVQVSGIVLVRQRPGSAKGVVFATLEDETGVANIIIWPKVFERFRRVVLGSRLLGVHGKLQKESGVIHVVAATLVDLTPHLESLSEAVPPSGDFLANADEVRRPVNEDQRLHRRRRAVTAEAKVLPKGRNFH